MSEVQGTPDGLIRTSPTIGNIIPALGRVHAAMGGTVRKDKRADTGKFSYEYVSLGAVQEASEGPMKAEGLFWISATLATCILVRIYHVSGEYIETEIAIESKGLDARGVGSASTFGRRYGLMALLGLSAEDDDAGAATDAHKPLQAAPLRSVHRTDAQPARKAAPPVTSSEGLPPCPLCHGEMNDNRPRKAQGGKYAKIPDLGCADWKNCKGLYWSLDEAPPPPSDDRPAGLGSFDDSGPF